MRTPSRNRRAKITATASSIWATGWRHQERMQRMVRSRHRRDPEHRHRLLCRRRDSRLRRRKAADQSVSFQTLLKNGVIIAGGSDSPGYWPVDPLRDIAACGVAQNALGRSLDTGGKRSPPPKPLPCTRPRRPGSGFEENDKGTLEVGKLADIAVLAEDHVRNSAERIKRPAGRDDDRRRRSQISGVSKQPDSIQVVHALQTAR